MKHSIHCVCNGTNEVSQTESKMLPTGTIIYGVRKVPCPWGSLRVNRPAVIDFTTDLDDFDF